MSSNVGYGRAHLDRASLTDDAPLRFVASSTGVNRYGFSLRNEGWRLDSFNRSPVFLWAHNATMPPIGRAPAKQEAGELASYVTFDRDDEFARTVESKYRRGFLNGVSVGFGWTDGKGEPADMFRMTPKQIREELFYDLEEISATPVPADPRALQQNQRLALSMLGRELVDLFDEQEHGDATVEEIRAAVHVELARLGIPIPILRPTAPPEPAGPAGSVVPEEPRDTGLQRDAAHAVLAAFNLGKEETGE